MATFEDTPQGFAEAVLTSIGAPTTPNNVNNMEVWMSAEGGSRENPLNVRQPGGGFAISDPEAGVASTVSVLRQSNMAPIAAALQSNVSLGTFTQAVIASPWDENHYQGTGFAAGKDAPLTSFSAGVTGDIESTVTGGLLGPGSAADTAGQSVAKAAGTETTFFADITSGVFWERIGVFALGATIFGISLIVFITNTKPGQKATTGVSSSLLADAPEALALA